jgi:hypothetical protein
VQKEVLYAMQPETVPADAKAGEPIAIVGAKDALI